MLDDPLMKAQQAWRGHSVVVAAWKRRCKWARKHADCFDGTPCAKQVRCNLRREYYERALSGARILHD